ncbi:MAG: AAA family ATPase [Candidatus Pacebacteria bacterium]|nr:AAA family ATPase [Candidatus Paceibacterota bacterium]
MEGISNKSTEKQYEISNFHQVFEDRLRIKKIVKDELGLDLDNIGDDQNSPLIAIFNKYYKQEYDELNEKAKQFKKADFKENEAKIELQKQKTEYEKSGAENIAQIDYEKIFTDYPDLKEVLDIKNSISALKDFRMKRTFEILNPKIGIKVKDKNEKILATIQAEIKNSSDKLEQENQTLVRQGDLLEYKQSLSESGHICIVPSVAKDLEAIGDRMLTGKPVFLHGPTGTGKTSLARYAAVHFTGKDSEMVFCNPQTKESNVWGKTGIKPAPNGAIETVEIHGPLAKAMVEGKTVIFDEFTALPKEQMVFIKGIFNAKVGDKINIVGNGIVEIQPGFQMIFTANLKSEKNPERQDLPPEVAREFEQNNIKINYINKEEAYDVMLSRMLNKDGSLDMSYYDLNTTLPNLARVMSEIQESYTNATDKEVARKAGALDASGNVHSLKKFVMTQGSIEAILSSWSIEKKMKRTDDSFAEFLDQRFKTALTFEEYSKEDRILVAKILASRGFLLTLTPQELGLPDDVFTLNTIKAMRGADAEEELKAESGNVKHLNFKEVAELDPFEKRALLMRKQAEDLLGNETMGTDEFLDKANKRYKKVFGKESSVEVIAGFEIEKKLDEFISFYQQNNIDVPPDFEQTIKEIWSRNANEIQKAIEENGFDDILLMPENMPLPDLHNKMTEGYTETWQGDNFKSGGSFAGAKSEKVDKPRIVLVHKTQNLKDNPELAKTLNIKGGDAIKSEILTLEDYLVFQRKYFKETGKHLDEDGWTWLATKSGARLVTANWDPSASRVGVFASGLGYQDESFGARPSRSFF